MSSQVRYRLTGGITEQDFYAFNLQGRKSKGNGRTVSWMMSAVEGSRSTATSGDGRTISSSAVRSSDLETVVELRSSQHLDFYWSSSILRCANSGKNREALRIYGEMLECGVQPSPQAFVAALKACCSLQDLESVKRIHLDVVRCGCEWDLHVATMLVNAYAKCRSLTDARQVFEKLPQRDVILWNVMILGYAQMDEGDEALQLYCRMKHEGVEPHGRTYVSALKACISVSGKHQSEILEQRARCLQTVRAIHGDIVKKRFLSNIYIGTMLVDAYAKCGSLEDARRVFETMSHRDVVTWNAMISAYAEGDDGAAALQLLARMQQEGILPDARTFVSVLKGCSRVVALEETDDSLGKVVETKCLDAVRAIHTDIVKRNLESNGFVGNMLVDVYAKCGQLEQAWHVFEKMANRDMVAWTTMIFAYSQANRGKEALDLFARMQKEGVVPDSQAYVCVLKACRILAEGHSNGRDVIAHKRRCLEVARTIHKDIVKRGLDTDVFLATMLVDVYGKCGEISAARLVFEKMPFRTVVSWNAMILGYSQTGKEEESLILYARMQQEGVAPDEWTYVFVLQACGNLADFEERDGHDLVACETKCLKAVHGVHSDVARTRSEMDVNIANSLLRLYAKCHSMRDARCLFDSMPNRNVGSWTAIISGYVEVDMAAEALKLYIQMQQQGVAPDDQAYVSALKACGCLSRLENGKRIHAQILKAGTGVMNSFLMSSLIDMYGKCGSMGDAQLLFDASPSRDIVTWGALISGYARQGDSEVVFQLFETMKQEGIHPDSVTFLSVLTVCSHVGLVDRGQKYFDAMCRDYGITPTMKHITCMVDLFGRAGHLDKAIEMAKRMPPQTASAAWNCVLGACQRSNNVELGRQAFQYAVQMDAIIAASCFTMTNRYAAKGMRKDAEEKHAMTQECAAWKQPGQSKCTKLRAPAHVYATGPTEGSRAHRNPLKIGTPIQYPVQSY